MAKNLISGSILDPKNLFSWILRLLVRHCSKLSFIQFKGKLMNQIEKMEKKTNFRPNFGFVWPKVRPPIFFQGFYLLLMLDIVVSYQYMQYQEKLMIQIQENCKKLQFGPDLGLLDPKSGRGIFFFFSKI